MRGISNPITIAILIIVAIGLAALLFLTSLKYSETKYVHVALSQASSPQCTGDTCHIFLNLYIRNFDQKLYKIKALYFSIITKNGVIQEYYGYNTGTGQCNNLQDITVVGSGCAEHCYISLCSGNITLPDMSERTYSIRIDFNRDEFIRSVAVVVVLYDSDGNEHRVSSNTVEIA